MALAPLGAGTAGVTAAFLTVGVGGAVYALLGRSVLPVGGPSSATAVVVAALVAQLVASPALPAGAAALPAVLAAVGLAVMGMGLLQVLLATARLGRLARFVPQPVLAGFMNGIALLIALAQLPGLLGLAREAWAARGLQALPQGHAGALLLGLATAGAMAALLRWRPRWPAALVGLLLATAAWHGAAAWLPGVALGPTLAPVGLPAVWPGPAAALGGDSGVLVLVRQHPDTLLVAMAVLALVGSLETLLNLRAIDQQLRTRHCENRELLAVGLGNVAGGALGALPMVMLRARAAGIAQAGGSGLVAALAAAWVSLLLLAAGGPVLALLPEAALAGVMLVVAVSLVDRWSPALLRQCRDVRRRTRVLPALLTMVLVAVATVALGPAAGVALGVALAVAAFVHRVRGQTLRWRGSAEARPSRRVYPPPLEQALAPLRRQVAVLELQGALFWGNAERVADEAEALPAPCRFVVLDLRRVSSVDESAAVELLRLDRRLAERAITLLPAGPPGTATEGRPWGDHLGDLAGAPPLPCWPDADRAIEHAERLLLAELGAAPDLLVQSVEPEDSVLMQGLTPAQQAAVRQRLRPCTLAAGERLFAEGDAAGAVYLLTRGSVTLTSTGATRFASFSPGTLIGELALLDGGGRSADAVADRPSELLALDGTALEQLAHDDPPLAALLYRRLALNLAHRLRVASTAWREAAG